MLIPSSWETKTADLWQDSAIGGVYVLLGLGVLFGLMGLTPPPDIMDFCPCPCICIHIKPAQAMFHWKF